MSTLVALLRFTAMETQNHATKKKGKTMNPLTQFTIRVLLTLIAAALVIGRAYAIDVSPDPVIYWSTEARKAIVPPSAGPENYGRRGSV
jgi:hypothetical protein